MVFKFKTWSFKAPEFTLDFFMRAVIKLAWLVGVFPVSERNVQTVNVKLRNQGNLTTDENLSIIKTTEFYISKWKATFVVLSNVSSVFFLTAEGFRELKDIPNKLLVALFYLYGYSVFGSYLVYLYHFVSMKSQLNLMEDMKFLQILIPSKNDHFKLIFIVTSFVSLIDFVINVYIGRQIYVDDESLGLIIFFHVLKYFAISPTIMFWSMSQTLLGYLRDKFVVLNEDIINSVKLGSTMKLRKCRLMHSHLRALCLNLNSILGPATLAKGMTVTILFSMSSLILFFHFISKNEDVVDPYVALFVFLWNGAVFLTMFYPADKLSKLGKKGSRRDQKDKKSNLAPKKRVMHTTIKGQEVFDIVYQNNSEDFILEMDRFISEVNATDHTFYIMSFLQVDLRRCRIIGEFMVTIIIWTIQFGAVLNDGTNTKPQT